MGLIKTLLKKRIMKEKTVYKMLKITSIVFYIAALLFFVFSFVRMKYMDAMSLEDLKTYISILLLWMGVLCLAGGFLELKSDITTIEGEIKDLKEKINE